MVDASYTSETVALAVQLPSVGSHEICGVTERLPSEVAAAAAVSVAPVRARYEKAYLRGRSSGSSVHRVAWSVTEVVNAITPVLGSRDRPPPKGARFIRIVVVESAERPRNAAEKVKV